MAAMPTARPPPLAGKAMLLGGGCGKVWVYMGLRGMVGGLFVRVMFWFLGRFDGRYIDEGVGG
jgi:hypothetical protein